MPCFRIIHIIRRKIAGRYRLDSVGLIYQKGFFENNFGVGSALGITLLGIVMIVNLIQLTLTGSFKKESE